MLPADWYLLTVKKVALSLVLLVGCTHAPVESYVERATPPLAPTGAADPQFDQPEPNPAQTGLGATTSSVTPKTTPESPSTTIVQPRPAQREVFEPPTTILRDASGLTLQNCIAYWESGNGTTSSNQFQFTLGTWHTYGGTGDPEDAEFSTQVRIFWIAWADDGPHHWAAQKGRCF